MFFYSKTIGFEVKNKKVYESGVTYQVQVWDTAGQERFCSLPSMHYNAAEGIIFAFDLQNEISFECLDRLLESINEKFEEENEIPKVLILLMLFKKNLKMFLIFFFTFIT